MAGCLSSLTLTTTDVEEAMEFFKKTHVGLEKMADYEMELTRESVMWSRFLWRDVRQRASCLAMVSALLTLFRMHLVGGVVLEKLDAVAYLDYNKFSEIEPMLLKIQREKISQCLVLRKIAEIQVTLDWLRPLLSCPGRPGTLLQGCYACLSDTVNHLIVYSQMVKTPHGELKYPS